MEQFGGLSHAGRMNLGTQNAPVVGVGQDRVEPKMGLVLLHPVPCLLFSQSLGGTVDLVPPLVLRGILSPGGINTGIMPCF